MPGARSRRRPLALVAVLATATAGCAESPQPVVPFDPSVAEQALPAVAEALLDGEPERALAELDRAAAAGELPDGALYLRGVALVDAHRAAEARAAFESEITVHSGDAAAHTQLARLLLDEGRADEAAAHLQQVRELQPGFPPALLQSGRLALLKRDDEQAQRCFRDYLAQDPYGEAAAEAHAALGEIAKRRAPDAADEARAHAATAEQLRQVHGLLRGSSARLHKDPRDADAAHGVAMAWLGLYVTAGPDPRLLANAEQALSVVLAVRPEDPRSLMDLGFIRTEQRRFDEALELSRRALAIDAQYSPAHVTLGGLLLRSGRADEGLAEFERGLQTARGPEEELRARIELVRCLASRPAPADWRRALEEARPLLEQDRDGHLGVAAVMQEVQRRLDAAQAAAPGGGGPAQPAPDEPARPPERPASSGGPDG
jgi:tetratricopeptide (TPR) repeat protein